MSTIESAQSGEKPYAVGKVEGKLGRNSWTEGGHTGSPLGHQRGNHEQRGGEYIGLSRDYICVLIEPCRAEEVA
jgi:hypothetical protein